MKDSQFWIIQLVVLLFYIPVMFYIFQRKRQRRAVAEFYRAVLSIIQRNEDLSECIEQIAIIYKKISENNSYISDNYRSSTDIVEDLLYRLESFGEDKFKGHYDMEFSNEEKDKVVDIIKEMKRKQPFSSLNSKHGNLLNLLKNSIDTNNVDLGNSSLGQLSDEVEILEGAIKSQSKRNQRKYRGQVLFRAFLMVWCFDGETPAHRV